MTIWLTAMYFSYSRHKINRSISSCIQVIVIIITLLIYKSVRDRYKSFGIFSQTHNLQQRLVEKMYLKSMKVLIIFLIVQTMISVMTNTLHIFLMSYQEYRFITYDHVLRMINYTLALPVWIYFDSVLRKTLLQLVPALKCIIKVVPESREQSFNHHANVNEANDILMNVWAVKQINQPKTNIKP